MIENKKKVFGLSPHNQGGEVFGEVEEPKQYMTVSEIRNSPLYWILMERAMNSAFNYPTSTQQ